MGNTPTESPMRLAYSALGNTLETYTMTEHLDRNTILILFPQPLGLGDIVTDAGATKQLNRPRTNQLFLHYSAKLQLYVPPQILTYLTPTPHFDLIIY